MRIGFAGGVSVIEKSDASVETTERVPVTPSVVPEIVAVPGPAARTTPAASTVTAAVLLEVKAKVFPVTVTPAAVRAVAFTVSPRPAVTLAGPATVTLAPTGGGGGGGGAFGVATGGVVGVS